MSHDVFVSHASEDRAVAEQVCEILERGGLSCWMAPRDIRPGMDWAEAVVAAIERSKAVVLVFSEHANASPAVGGELEKAFALEIPVFPFRIRAVEPSKKIELFIRRVQWLDALTPPIEQQIHRLANAIHSVLGTEQIGDGPAAERAPLPNGPKATGFGRSRRFGKRGVLFAVACVSAVALAALAWHATRTARLAPPLGKQAAEEPPNRSPEVFENSIGMKFVRIAAGSFRMGATSDKGSPHYDADARDTEMPQHVVTITRDFYLGAYEVTQRQYAEMMGDHPSRRTDAGVERPTGDMPVTNVAWHDAAEFCRKLGEKEDRVYRLPTEAEWEYACRAGSQTRFPNGDALEDLMEIAVVAGEDANPGQPMEVGRLKPNLFGLYDILGNVREFCGDWYGQYAPEPQTDPRGPDSGEKHVVRGGCYHFIWTDARCTSRFPVEDAAPNVGFRVLLEIPTQE